MCGPWDAFASGFWFEAGKFGFGVLGVCALTIVSLAGALAASRIK